MLGRKISWSPPCGPDSVEFVCSVKSMSDGAFWANVCALQISLSDQASYFFKKHYQVSIPIVGSASTFSPTSFTWGVTAGKSSPKPMQIRKEN